MLGITHTIHIGAGAEEHICMVTSDTQEAEPERPVQCIQ